MEMENFCLLGDVGSKHSRHEAQPTKKSRCKCESNSIRAVRLNKKETLTNEESAEHIYCMDNREADDSVDVLGTDKKKRIKLFLMIIRKIYIKWLPHVPRWLSATSSMPVWCCHLFRCSCWQIFEREIYVSRNCRTIIQVENGIGGNRYWDSNWCSDPTFQR